MIKNQFMKLSRDACHKRKSWSDLGGDSDSGHCRPDAKKVRREKKSVFGSVGVVAYQ